MLKSFLLGSFALASTRLNSASEMDDADIEPRKAVCILDPQPN
jgi:hypothetical protein